MRITLDELSPYLLADLTLILFGASRCSPCIAEARSLAEITVAAKGDPVIVAWTDGGFARARVRIPASVQIASQAGATGPWKSHARNTRGLPFSVMLDRSGRACALVKATHERRRRDDAMGLPDVSIAQNRATIGGRMNQVLQFPTGTTGKCRSQFLASANPLGRTFRKGERGAYGASASVDVARRPRQNQPANAESTQSKRLDGFARGEQTDRLSVHWEAVKYHTSKEERRC